MNELKYYFETNKSNLIDKWHHYFDVYETYFKRYRKQKINFLEIGVFQGGSLLMWEKYFSADSIIYGIDINPLCKKLEKNNIKILIGSQSDKEFLKSVISEVPKFDIIVDDGGHTMDQQITSFEILFDHLNEGGIYLCEDTHTSYWKEWGGGLKKKHSFIEFSKNLIDEMHAWHIDRKIRPISNYTRSIKSIHFYDSLVVFEKEVVKEPSSSRNGLLVFPIQEFIEKSNKIKKLSYFRRMIEFFSSIMKRFRNYWS